jgi:hypothetical protein
VAFNLLRETTTILCGTTLDDDPDDDPHSIPTENRPIELTDPAIRLGNHALDSNLPGELGTERHRKRFNPETGYITGGETTHVDIEKRPLPQLMELVEEWVRGVAARKHSGIRESDIQEVLDLARRLKKNQHNNSKDDLDIVSKVRFNKEECYSYKKQPCVDVFVGESTTAGGIRAGAPSRNWRGANPRRHYPGWQPAICPQTRCRNAGGPPSGCQYFRTGPQLV